MKVALITTIICTTMLAGCNLFESEEDKAKKAVAERLRDPSSAQFRNVKGGEKRGMYNVCGEVNGKNSYGAYAGYERFVASNGGKAIYLESEWPTFEVRWITDCP
ncbi:hypothetical protein [Halomonas campaniensis]|uniref:hypothetical protein n=1 Tax=Halomonas campaniensis TaxID=213554 RepID=UPI000B535159|nr:hypothetical protein [Halomonas campaniensis]